MARFLLPLALVLASGLAQAANQAVLTFTAPTAYTDATPIPDTIVLTFGVYQAIKGQPKVKVATIPSATHTISTDLLPGKTYCWQVSAIASGKESGLSNQACKTFPPLIPAVPTLMVVQ